MCVCVCVCVHWAGRWMDVKRVVVLYLSYSSRTPLTHTLTHHPPSSILRPQVAALVAEWGSHPSGSGVSEAEERAAELTEGIQNWVMSLCLMHPTLVPELMVRAVSQRVLNT